MTPRAALTKHLLDGDDSILTGNFDKPVSTGSDAAEAGAARRPRAKPASRRPTTPFDSDAT